MKRERERERDLRCYAEIQWWRHNQWNIGTRHEALASNHREIYTRRAHNMDDEDHGNQVANTYRQFHEDHHVERRSEHLIDEWART